MPSFIPLTRGGAKGKCVVVLSHQRGNTQLLTSSPMPPTSQSNNNDFVDIEMQDKLDTRVCIHEQSFRDVACQTPEDIENEHEENPQPARRAKTSLTPLTPREPRAPREPREPRAPRTRSYHRICCCCFLYF